MNELMERLTSNVFFQLQMAWASASPAQKMEWAIRQQCEEQYVNLCWVLNSDERASAILREIETEADGDWSKALVALRSRIEREKMG